MTKFECIRKELHALCNKHGILITSEGYDALELWDAQKAGEIDEEMLQLRNKLTPPEGEMSENKSANSATTPRAALVIEPSKVSRQAADIYGKRYPLNDVQIVSRYLGGRVDPYEGGAIEQLERRVENMLDIIAYLLLELHRPQVLDICEKKE